jgi:flagellin-like protein
MKRAWIIRRNEEAVSPVIATILMVAITVVLAAVLYVMVSGLIGGTTTAEPNVQFSQATPGPAANQSTVTCAGVSEAVDFDNFKAILLRDAVEVDQMATLSETCTSDICFNDLDGGGKLSVGDYFIVDTTGGGSYKLSVIWKDSGNERGFEEWET